MAAFLGIMTIASILSQKVRIPYTMVLVLLGVGLAAASLSIILGVDLIYDQLIGGGLFVGLVVPPLIFSALQEVPRSEFRAIARPAFVLATVGVVISTFVVGILLWQLARLPLYASFLFAAVISPTDVATVIEIFKRAKVPTRLATLMETEAAFNDATAIVVFTILLTGEGLTRHLFLSALAEFSYVFVGGVAVGFAIAFAARFLSKLTKDPLSEIALTMASVYGSYTLASSISVSGLVAVAVVGLYYGGSRPRAGSPVRIFWEIAAFVANSVAFLFIGLSTDVVKLASSILPIAVAFLAVVLARVASVYPILGVSDKTGLRTPLKWKNVAMLGGMRGALSIALAASIPATVASRDLIATMVLGVAFISIMGQGPVLSRYITSRFKEESKQGRESLDVRLEAALLRLQDLHQLRLEGLVTDEDYLERSESAKAEIDDVLRDIRNISNDEKNGETKSEAVKEPVDEKGQT